MFDPNLLKLPKRQVFAGGVWAGIGFPASNHSTLEQVAAGGIFFQLNNVFA